MLPPGGHTFGFFKVHLLPFRHTFWVAEIDRFGREGHVVWMLQGYLAHKKLHPPRTLQQEYAEGPMVVLGGGGFVMSEVPLYPGSEVFKLLVPTCSHTRVGDQTAFYGGTPLVTAFTHILINSFF